MCAAVYGVAASGAECALLWLNRHASIVRCHVSAQFLFSKIAIIAFLCNTSVAVFHAQCEGRVVLKQAACDLLR